MSQSVKARLNALANMGDAKELKALFDELRGSFLYGSATWNPGSLIDAAGETSAGITVTGAALGDFVIAAAPYDMQDIMVSAYVQAANTVEIRIQNESGATVDLASGTWKVLVIKASAFTSLLALGLSA